MKSKVFFFVAVFLIWVLSLNAQPPASDYRLVFSDHFNDTLLDGNAWWVAGDGGSCITHGTGDCEEDM